MADMLRRSNKPVFLVVNKVDNHERLLEASEFYSLGLIYFQTYSTISTMLLVFLIVCSLKLFLLRKKKEELNKEKVFAFLKVSFIMFSVENTIAAVTPFFRIIFCVNVNGSLPNQKDYRLLRSLEIPCFSEEHNFHLFLLSAPIIAFFTMAIPLYLGIKIVLTMRRKELNNFEFLRKFGLFIVPYKKSAAYY